MSDKYDKTVNVTVDELFTNGAGQKADRLVLWRDRGPLRATLSGNDLGGWCRSAVADRIAALVRREVEKEKADAGVAGEIAAERERQKSVEGWTDAHDDQHERGELAYAAGCYAGWAHIRIVTPPASWPWSGLWWKQKDARRDLIRAGALIVAEIERLDRAAAIRARGEKEGG